MSAPSGLAGAVAALSAAHALGRQLAAAARAALAVPAVRQGMAVAGTAGLLWLLSAGAAGAQELVTVRWPTRPGIEAYVVQGQSAGTGWAQVVAVNAKDCPAVPAECSTVFPAPTVYTCYRVMVLNLFGSRASRVALCHDPAATAPPPLETLGGTAGNATP